MEMGPFGRHANVLFPQISQLNNNLVYEIAKTGHHTDIFGGRGEKRVGEERERERR